MSRSFQAGVSIFVCLLTLSAGMFGQDKPPDKASAVAPTSGPRAEFLNELKGKESKFVRLADADKFTWRPAPEVRSIAEVYLQVAAANYNPPGLIGTPPPEGFQAKGFDKSTTDESKVIHTSQESFNFMREAFIKMPDADLEKPLDWFGTKNTERGILLFIMRHMGEHLGQSIAMRA